MAPPRREGKNARTTGRQRRPRAAVAAPAPPIVRCRWDWWEGATVVQRRNALVHRALMTGERTPFDFQPFDDASKRFYRGHGNWHETEARDFLRFDLAEDE